MEFHSRAIWKVLNILQDRDRWGQEETRSPCSKGVLSFKVILSPVKGCLRLM